MSLHWLEIGNTTTLVERENLLYYLSSVSMGTTYLICRLE